MHTTSWLVDVGYVVKASEGHFKLDYIAAEQFLRETCGPTQTFLFNGFDPAYGVPAGLQAFYNAMRHHGMRVLLHPMDSGAPGANRQRRVDVDLCAHLVWQASLPTVQTLALTTGDQDFVPAVELVRNEFRKPIVLFTYAGMVSHDLVNAVSEWWTFDAARMARR